MSLSTNVGRTKNLKNSLRKLIQINKNIFYSRNPTSKGIQRPDKKYQNNEK